MSELRNVIITDMEIKRLPLNSNQNSNMKRAFEKSEWF